MKASEIRELSVEEIQSRIQEEKAKYQQLRLTHKMSPVDNPLLIKSSRRNIARLNTELTRKLKESHSK